MEIKTKNIMETKYFLKLTNKLIDIKISAESAFTYTDNDLLK